MTERMSLQVGQMNGLSVAADKISVSRSCYVLVMMTWCSLAHCVFARCFSSFWSVACILYTLPCN